MGLPGFRLDCDANVADLRKSVLLRQRFIERLIAFMIYPPQYENVTNHIAHLPTQFDVRRERLIHVFRARTFNQSFKAFLEKKIHSDIRPEQQVLAADFQFFLQAGGVEELTRCTRRQWLNKYGPMRPWRQWMTVYRGLDYTLCLHRVGFDKTKFV